MNWTMLGRVCGVIAVLQLGLACSSDDSSDGAESVTEGTAADTSASPTDGSAETAEPDADGDGADTPDTAADTGEPDSVEPDGALDSTDAGDPTDGPCDRDGARICVSETALAVCINEQWVEQACPGTLECVQGYCVETVGCEPGALAECIDTTTASQCDPEGQAFVPTPCPRGQYCLNGACGEQLCEPNTFACMSETLLGICNEAGTAYVAAEDCGGTQVCVRDECISGCDGFIKQNLSYVGCEFWSIDMDQIDGDPTGSPKDASYGVVISNPGVISVTATFITAPDVDVEIAPVTVLPGQATQVVLPSLNVDDTGVSSKGVRIVTDFPAIVHQFNPMNNASNPFEVTASNDASLLLPTHALGTEYYVMTWPSRTYPSLLGIVPQQATYSVVAVEEGETTVVVESSAYTKAGERLEAMAPGDSMEVVLQQFEVLNVESYRDDIELPPIATMDPTGTHIYADRNIVVFSGHEAAVIAPDTAEDACCAEHLEEQMVPVASWRTHYIASKTRPRGTSQVEPDVWRVLASEDGTILSTDPPVSGLNGVTLNRGEWAQAFTPQSFELSATAPVQVAQYTVGQAATQEGIGDPTLIMAVPTEQYRTQYTILTPSYYDSDWCSVIRKTGVDILFDGEVLPDGYFLNVGLSGWEVGYVPVDAGVHNVGSTEPFGLVSYGWSDAVSYGFPGGMNLK